MGDDELVGFWSHDMLYNSAMEAHWLVFCRSGEGCHAYLRPGATRGSVVTWRLDGDRPDHPGRALVPGRPPSARRGDGLALDLRGAAVLLSERFAFQLQRRTRLLGRRASEARRWCRI